MITVTNTLGGKKEPFIPLSKKCVRMYVCGVTPYDYAHIGHARCYVTFDVLYRLLKNSGFQVVYCRNYTDIDDKLLVRAQKDHQNKMAYKKVADQFIKTYQQDMHNLNCLVPDYEPRATEVIPEILIFIKDLIKKGHAYEVDGNVYFRVKSFSSYGKLSGRNIDDLRVGARVEVDLRKESPLDFALWKAESDESFWKSPWGYGRPGWHIECSVMARKYLGDHLDVHAGGMDLIFPHHENEIAQSESLLGPEFSKYWLHNAFVRIDKEKMSKSVGNFFTLRELFEQFDPMVVRFYLLNHHYRSPIDFSFMALKEAEKSYRKLCKSFSAMTCPIDGGDEHINDSPLVKRMLSFVYDDLNTVGMWGVVFENLGDFDEQMCAVKGFLQKVLGLTLQPLLEKEVKISPDIQRLLDEREQARVDKNWTRADAIRDKLNEMGVRIQDKKHTKE